MKLNCAKHGLSHWNGECVCDCGRAHKLTIDNTPDWKCSCGATDPEKVLNPICQSCYRHKIAQQEKMS
jgi:hypothetical protein